MLQLGEIVINAVNATEVRYCPKVLPKQLLVLGFSVHTLTSRSCLL